MEQGACGTVSNSFLNSMNAAAVEFLGSWQQQRIDYLKQCRCLGCALVLLLWSEAYLLWL
jgi:hypothetical protein